MTLFVIFNTDSMELFYFPKSEQNMIIVFGTWETVVPIMPHNTGVSLLPQQQVHIIKWLKYSMNVLIRHKLFFEGINVFHVVGLFIIEQFKLNHWNVTPLNSPQPPSI